jgi:hypothetical protein
MLSVNHEGLFWVATPNVFILMNFFGIVGKPFYTNALSSLIDELVGGVCQIESGRGG